MDHKSIYTILSRVNTPDDVKKLSKAELPVLCDEIRDFLIREVSKGGGHLASNLGVVELTVALHRVFNSPKDKILWDVGHQSYVHKILTGRKDRFNTIRQYGGLSGFPKRSESPHDILETGHASTSISAALGMKVGEDIEHSNDKIIVVIGDGALTAGLALEGINSAGLLKKNLIIILNDNSMSISKNVGAIAKHLAKLKATTSFLTFRSWYDNTVESIPVIGDKLLSATYRAKSAVKAYLKQENIFTYLGYDYFGPLDGHNLDTLIKIFNNVRDINEPILIHINTVKGKGYLPAEKNPTIFHGISPVENGDSSVNTLTWNRVFGKYLVERAKDDPDVIAITAAMKDGTGLLDFSEKFPDRFFDVGIAEQHAVTFASGLALSHRKPVVAIYSTFAQRAVDQIIHDVAIPQLPVIIALDRAGIVPGDGETHQGVFDIPLLRSIPGLTITAPADSSELAILLDYGFANKGPFVIRYPKAKCPNPLLSETEPAVPGRGVFIKNNNSPVLLIGTGSMTKEMILVSENLELNGIPADVYNLRFIKPIDREYLKKITINYRYIFTAEESSLLGGIGEEILSILKENSPSQKVINFGVPDSFITHGPRSILLKYCGLDAGSLTDSILKHLKKAHIPQLKHRAFLRGSQG
ncbi:MAG: 1-deoxy-D-xylulose-5-phosphate synthase [Spirochaetales bacterium]|nr:1-deoxy-D-xylulose-5-phosphate synthase [Spirochaetales bacterium]